MDTTKILDSTDLGILYDKLFTDGGFTVTFDGDGQAAPALHGYAVSVTDRQHLAPLAAVSFGHFTDAAEYLVNAYPSADGIGGWVEGCTLYLDPIMVTPSRTLAEETGRANAQPAIYDLDSQTAITL
jgi:hypothetical protein